MGLFDDVIYGQHSGIESTIQLSYEEESFIEREITTEPDSLSNYNINAFTAWTALEGALYVSEAYAAKEILSGVDRRVAMESLANRAADAYDTIKRWATKIWKAIKKFVLKAWNRIKAIKDKIVAYFTNYEDVLRDYDGDFTVKNWVELNIEGLAKRVNTDYKNHVDQIEGRATGGGYGGNHSVDPVILTVNEWRTVLYGDNNTTPVFANTTWKKIKGQVMQITRMGYDKYAADFIKWGEKDYRDAMSLDKDRVDDSTDDYEDIERKPNEKHSDYYNRREVARGELLKIQTRLHLRQRGIQLLTSATNRMYQQCLAAAKQAISHKHGVAESYNPVNGINSISFMY